jgi:hypothetical protein
LRGGGTSWALASAAASTRAAETATKRAIAIVRVVLLSRGPRRGAAGAGCSGDDPNLKQSWACEVGRFSKVSKTHYKSETHRCTMHTVLPPPRSPLAFAPSSWCRFAAVRGRPHRTCPPPADLVWSLHRG